MSSHQRGPWTRYEDLTLLKLVAMLGASNWVQLSDMMGTRNPKQCAERYHQNLKPGLDDSPLTEHERHLIAHLVSTKGTCWAHIARQLVNRSENKVKNWWYSVRAKFERHQRRSRKRAAKSSHRAHVQAEYVLSNGSSTIYAASTAASLLRTSWTPEDFESQNFVTSSEKDDYIHRPMRAEITHLSRPAPLCQPAALNKHIYLFTGQFSGHNIGNKYSATQERVQDPLQANLSRYRHRVHSVHDVQRKSSSTPQSMPELVWPPLGHEERAKASSIPA
ncbi:hypothetical protein D6D17_02340 [Aureobasidium pullulans]|nr:hypothetical protein D6D17_02340 [Aureobasidium pullulans]